MKIKNLLFIITGALLASCANDSNFFPSYDDVSDWKTSLDEIITDNGAFFKNQGVKITDIVFLEDIGIDRDLFYGDQYGFFPVFTKQDSVLKIVTYRELIDNSNKYCFDTTSVNRKINNILHNHEDYDVVRLTWSFQSDVYNSISLFNKRSGELEYDNMFFNISALSKYDQNKFTMFMRGVEFQFDIEYSTVIDSIDIEYRDPDSNDLEAYIKGKWTINGYFEPDTYYLNQDDNFKYYVTKYTYRYLNMSCVSFPFIADATYDTFFGYVPLSQPMSKNYKFAYALWAGPANAFINKIDYSLTSSNYSSFNSKYTAGNGDWKEVTDTPQKDDYYFRVEKVKN